MLRQQKREKRTWRRTNTEKIGRNDDEKINMTRLTEWFWKTERKRSPVNIKKTLPQWVNRKWTWMVQSQKKVIHKFECPTFKTDCLSSCKRCKVERKKSLPRLTSDSCCLTPAPWRKRQRDELMADSQNVNGCTRSTKKSILIFCLTASVQQKK